MLMVMLMTVQRATCSRPRLPFVVNLSVHLAVSIVFTHRSTRVWHEGIREGRQLYCITVKGLHYVCHHSNLIVLCYREDSNCKCWIPYSDQYLILLQWLQTQNLLKMM